MLKKRQIQSARYTKEKEQKGQKAKKRQKREKREKTKDGDRILGALAEVIYQLMIQ